MRFSIGIFYFGLMEALQTVQYAYVAKPDDGYAMCNSPMNQGLTTLGLIHIAFQPVFVNLMRDGLPYQESLASRIRSDFVLKLCILGGIWQLSRYYLSFIYPEGVEGVHTAECQNYEWIRSGWDSGVGALTPNLPGHSCTYLPDTTSGHLAWAVPMRPSSYLTPGVALHSFLMFVPALISPNKGSKFCGAFTLLSGPIFAMYVTPSMNEQAAIWCFFSVIQVTLLSILAMTLRPDEEEEHTIEHNGGSGFWKEKRLFFSSKAKVI